MTDEYNIRRENLANICREFYQNKRKNLLDALNTSEHSMSPSQLNKLLTQKSSGQNITEDKAREIEKILNLEAGYLDRKTKAKRTYYVTLKVGGNRTYRLAMLINKLEFPVVECAAVLGDFDLFLKVEVDEMHDLERILDRLTCLPGVLRTRTYHVVESLHWQRKQFEIPVSAMKDPTAAQNYAEVVRHRRILHYLKSIKDVSGDKIACNNDSIHETIELVELMRQATKEVLAIRLHDETIESEEDYIKAESQLNQRKIEYPEKDQSTHGQCKRIITLPKDLFQSNTKPSEKSIDKLKGLVAKAKQLIDRGSEIRFISEERWISTSHNRIKLECFAIVDREYVYVRISDKESVIYTNSEDVETYQKIFLANWGSKDILNYSEAEQLLKSVS
jgi:DNA-binding Lrp family transcriptional regulator